MVNGTDTGNEESNHATRGNNQPNDGAPAMAPWSAIPSNKEAWLPQFQSNGIRFYEPTSLRPDQSYGAGS